MGFEAARKRGSQVHDPFTFAELLDEDDTHLLKRTRNNAGRFGGRRHQRRAADLSCGDEADFDADEGVAER